MSARDVHNAFAQIIHVYGSLLAEQERLLALQVQATTRQAAREAALQEGRDKAVHEQEQLATDKIRLLEEVADLRSRLRAAYETPERSDS